MVNEKTKRGMIETRLMRKSPYIKPFLPKENHIISGYKDGSFGLSSVAFALYSNGHNLRGKSTKHPFGLIYDDGHTIFSISYYEKELDKGEGYIFFVAPRGKGVVGKINRFSEEIMNDPNITCGGIYVRFLTLNQYIGLLNNGFVPAKESPWHPESIEEDESFCHSIISLSDFNSVANMRKNSRRSYMRFRNFLKRNGLEFNIEKLSKEKIHEAKSVIEEHFSMLRSRGKAIGSTPEDHFNAVSPEIIGLKDVEAYICYLGKIPVSILVGEMISENRFALYTPFTLRDIDNVLPKLGDQIISSTGFTAMPVYAYLTLFRKLISTGIGEVHLGGSELPELNRFKRQFGGRNDPSYWAFRPRIQ